MSSPVTGTMPGAVLVRSLFWGVGLAIAMILAMYLLLGAVSVAAAFFRALNGLDPEPSVSADPGSRWFRWCERLGAKMGGRP